MKIFSILFGLLAVAALMASIFDQTARHQITIFFLSALMAAATRKYGKIEKAKK